MSGLRRCAKLSMMGLMGFVVLPLLALADEAKVKEATKEAQRASGVIIKVAKPAKAGTAVRDGPYTVRLTINTNAVWRDWVRDQVADRPNETAKKAAAEGASSVAAQGEPQDKNALVTVEVAEDARIETRFRAPDDESSQGSKSPNDAKRTTAKPTQFQRNDLKPGLFVEVDFRRQGDHNQASSVTVIRPIGPKASSTEK